MNHFNLMKLIKLLKVFFLAVLMLVAPPADAQYKTADYLGRWLSKTSSVVQQASQFLKETAAPLVNTFKKTQEFFHKAQTVVRASVKHFRYIQRSVQIHQDIRETFNQSMMVLTEPIDRNNDGLNDYDFLDKWKHTQILLSIVGEAGGIFDILETVLEDDAYTMDDQGRIIVLREVYTDLLKLKKTIKAHRRIIDREVYTYRRLKKETEIFESLFSS